MTSNVWQTIERPIMALAPMEDVTDTVFRRVIADCGRPDVMFTEFTSADGICSSGHDRVVHRLRYTEKERPLIAQIWGITPEHYEQSAEMIRKLGFDGIDINMGCPVKKIINQGACSYLINKPDLATDIIQATQHGAGELPVSVKTRLGFGEIATEEWIGHLLDHDIDALTIHGRTVKQMSEVAADWNEIGKAVKIRERKGKSTPILGNGDVENLWQAYELAERYRLDGVMVGKGVFRNPYFFAHGWEAEDVSKEEKLRLFTNHVRLYEDEWQGEKNFNVMKKFLKMYINGFPGASHMRGELFRYESASDMIEALASLTPHQTFSDRI
ncbi:MAG: dihydrouridine synthase [Parcubacteria group bacterium SW_4_49_11]|nr:MAG: dihydrouridine synthase [Parcubacteria group bacterium SW_4_49_11]